MGSILKHLRIPIAVIELIAWLPASFMGLTLIAAYVVAGNAPPPTLVAGFLLVPVTLLVGPIYALTPHARARPLWTVAALASPLPALLLTYVAEASSLTHGHL
jgi:hypothetical protein